MRKSIINVLGVGLGATRKDSTKEGPVKSINVPLDSKTQANSKFDFPCPYGFCIQTSSLVLDFCHMPTITYNAQKHGTVETVGTLETVETVPGVLTRWNFSGTIWKISGTNWKISGTILYGKFQELSWNALAAWQISIRKFPCLLTIFNYTKIWSKHHFQAHGIRQFCGGEQKQPHADSES